MSSFKCPKCGLVNFVCDPVCKRCGKHLVEEKRKAKAAQNRKRILSQTKGDSLQFLFAAAIIAFGIMLMKLFVLG